MKIAVVILNWNGKKLLEKFLPSVLACSKDEAVIYVADNCSNDDSVEFIRKCFPEVHVIVNKTNLGFAGGYNECLKHIAADYFILLNTDIEVTPGWITPVVQLMEQDPGVGACQPKILSFDRKDQFEYAGASGGFIDHFGYPFCRGRIFQTVEKDKGQYDQAEEIFWASGACLFVRASVFNDLKGFDDTFFAHMEEIDLCWRIKRNGFRVMVQPKSLVYHVGGGTLSRSNPRKTYLNFRNNLLMLHKNLPMHRLYLVIPFRLLMDGIAGIKFLFSDSPADFLAVLKAHFYFYLHLPERRQIRKRSTPLQESLLIKGIYRGSLVFEYYILKNRFFSGLRKDKFS